jgi:hypothetical protein
MRTTAGGTDLNNLRAILDEYEGFAAVCARENAGKRSIAEEIRAVIEDARGALHPSADGTANYVDTRQILERLNALRARAETAP